MPVKLKKNSKAIASLQFPLKAKGYDALEVDLLLDQIVKDYEDVEQNILLSKDEYDTLLKRKEELEREIINLKIELDNEKSRWKYIKNEGKDIHIDNLELLQRIGKLEKYIYEKLHLNPDQITNFDPDDC